MSTGGMWKKLANLPEQYIYLLLAIILAVPLLHPFGLPVPITPATQKFYAAIDGLKPGDTIFYAFDAGSMTWMEQGLGSTVVLKHLLQKPGVRIVGATIGAEGPMFWENAINALGGVDKYGKTYGKDVVWLGYFSGAETACSALAKNLASATNSLDAYGTSFNALPLMSEVNEATDFKLLVCLSYGGTWSNWMNQWVIPYNVPEYVIPLAAVVAEMTPNIKAGQVQSIINGARGAAEYELLLGQPGRAAAGMDAQSLGHIYVAILIIVGNIAFFMSGGRKK
jgi:hypothetical protein